VQDAASSAATASADPRPIRVPRRSPHRRQVGGQ
jgi:hypothetical protein